MPRSPANAEYRKAAQAHLDRLTPALTDALRKILASRHDPATHHFRFEYDSPEFGDCFPVMFFLMDNHGNNLKARRLLPKEPFTIPPELFDDPRWEEAGLNTWDITSNLLQKWFADCWHAVGGENCKWPAFIAHHDSLYALNMKTRKEEVIDYL